MASIGVALPVTRDSGDGFTMLKSLAATIKQNFKMLVLTSPGERVMEPEFGVGLRLFLFQNFDSSTTHRIETRIRDQVMAYMPAIKITNVIFNTEHQDQNLLGITIVYDIPAVATAEMLQITI